MRSLVQYLKESAGPWKEAVLIGNPREDGYTVIANMTNSEKSNVDPEFKNGVLTLKVLKGDWNDDYIYLSSSLSNTFDAAVKKFDVKKIVLQKCSSVSKIFIPELVDGVDIDAPDYDVVIQPSSGFKGAATVTDSKIKCQNFIVDHRGKVLFDKIDVECTDKYFQIWETNTLACFKPSCKIDAPRLVVNNAKAALLKKLTDMKEETSPDAFAKLDISKILGLKANCTWNKISVNLARWDGSAIFVKNGETVISDHGTEFELKDGWTITFTEDIEPYK